MDYNKIEIYLRQTNHNKISNTRPHWFNYEKTFVNLLNTINYNLASLTIVFDGELKGHFTEKYVDKFPFRIVRIDTSSFIGETYEKNCGSSKSGALTAFAIKNDNLSEKSLIYINDNDYLHLPYFCEHALDLINTLEDQNVYISLYDHLDKHIFNKNTDDHWGMYKNLTSKIILSNARHYRYVPNITSAWVIPKNLFDRDFSALSIGISDNTHCFNINKEYNTKFLSPIPTLSTHCQLPFLAPLVDWEKLQNSYNVAA